MFCPSEVHDLLSGRRRSWRATLLRGVLRAAEVPYGMAMVWRNRRYARGSSTVHQVAVPVVSVGNLTVGGTGKTPLVEWLARWFRARQVRVALISRGYGAEAGGRNDEALELEEKLPDVPHLQNPDRVEAAQTAIDELDCQLILLDDAFQHRRIHRDLDIVLIDALEPFGYGHLLPRGLLREPLSGLGRADVVVLSRSDAVPASQRNQLRQQVCRLAPQAAWVEVAHQPQGLLAAGGNQADVRSLAGRPVAAFCGIGNPSGFRQTLERCGYQVAAFREFPDHHVYQRQDIESLVQWVQAAGELAAVVCTQKDLVKIRLNQLGNQPLWALTIGLELLDGREALEDRLQPLLPAAEK